MKSFFKIFFASLLALILFSAVGIFLLIGMISSAATPETPVVGNDAVLVLDLSDEFREQSREMPFSRIINAETEAPSLYDMVRMIQYAKKDSSIKGIYIRCNDNANGFAASEELRAALQDFKKSDKFLIAYGEAISQKAYFVANIADKLYCHPMGGLDWRGFSSGVIFLKGMLDKLNIEPQIFYAGKFKSATEPLRETRMTEANRLQTSVWLNDLYSVFLQSTAASRKLDTAALRQLAVSGAVQTAHDALKYQLVDGLKYDDEVKAEILHKLRSTGRGIINFVTFHDYAKAVAFKQNSYGNKIALVYASGDIVDGQGADEQVASDVFKNILREARLNSDVKAIVLRVNSPGGSSLASDVIWRELDLARKEKPVVVSMGDMAASGGYYIACNADSVFANASTLTGSIGVFSIVPNFEPFLRNKLGITADRVSTAPYADMGSGNRALSPAEKQFFQSGVDSVYHQFKSRVASGRKQSIEYIDSIAQGRVWTGTRAKTVGLVDRIGTLQDAVKTAAHMAKLDSYWLVEYPEHKGLLEQIMGNYKKSIRKDLIREELGETEWMFLSNLQQVRQMVGKPQARIPFALTVH